MDTKLKFLLTDDDEDDRSFFHYASMKFTDKLDIITFEDGEHLMEFLTNTKEANPSLVLLDINMPRIDGFDCLEYIRNSSTWKHLPVVMYSTSDDYNDINKSFHAGANSYIVKPRNIQSLENLIRKLITSDFSKRPDSLNGFMFKYS